MWRKALPDQRQPDETRDDDQRLPQTPGVSGGQIQTGWREDDAELAVQAGWDLGIYFSINLIFLIQILALH